MFAIAKRTTYFSFVLFFKNLQVNCIKIANFNRLKITSIYVCVCVCVT